MKIYISFKSPDSVFYALRDSFKNLSKEQKEDIEDFLGEYIQYGEYARIEFDTDNKTATVVKL